MAADLDDNFLSVHNGSDAGAQRICGHLLRIIVKETGVNDSCVSCELSEAGAGCKGSAGLVESDVAVDADAAQEQVDAAVRSDLRLIVRALCFQILCKSIQDIDVLLRNIDMIKEIIMHEVPVALVVLFGKSYILVHVEGNDVLEGNLACLIHSYQLIVDADRGGAGGKAQNERSVFLVRLDLSRNVISCPFAHVVVIFLNNYSHFNLLVFFARRAAPPVIINYP